MARTRHYQKNRRTKIPSQNILELKNKLENKASTIDNHFKRMLYVAGIISSALQDVGIKPIVVGGFAVEFYTLGSYTTHDIDFAIAQHKEANKIFQELGFSKQGRHWYHESADVAIESPASALEDADYNMVTEVKTEESTVYIIGIEDLILDRLRAAVYWKSEADLESAKDLLVNNNDQIDFDYLRQNAIKEEKIIKVLDEIS